MVPIGWGNFDNRLHADIRESGSQIEHQWHLIGTALVGSYCDKN